MLEGQRHPPDGIQYTGKRRCGTFGTIVNERRSNGNNNQIDRLAARAQLGYGCGTCFFAAST